MRTLILGLAISLAAVTAHAQRAPDSTQLLRQQQVETADISRSTAQRGAEPDEAKLLSHRHYKASNGQEVHSPAKTVGDTVPAGASAKCRDGSYSFSQSRRGTCSHHGGVGSWL